MLRRRLILMLQGGYRWIVVKMASVMGRKADLTSAPGRSVEVERAVQIGRKVEANGFPAADLEARRGVQIGKKIAVDSAPAQPIVVKRAMRMSGIRLSAYGIVPIKLRKYLPMMRRADGDSAPTKSGTSKWTMPMGLKADGSSADAQTTEAKWTMRTGRTAVLDSGTGIATEAHRSTNTGRVAVLDSADAYEVATSRGMRMGSRFSAATWGDPVLLEDGTLLIKQAYYAEVIDGVLEVR